MTTNKNHTAATSQADKVLDAVSQVRKDQKEASLYGCIKCGSESYTPRRSLGGPLIKICNSCGYKNEIGTGRGYLPLIETNLLHEQGDLKGPTKKDPTPEQDKHQPTYRTKGQGRSDERE